MAAARFEQKNGFASTTRCVSSAPGWRSRCRRRRRDAVGQGARAHHGALCRSRHAPARSIELGPGTGPVTEALVEHGVDPARLVLVEFNPDLLPAAAHALSRGDGGAGRRLQSATCCWPASCRSRPRRWCPACRCSPSRCEMRLRLFDEAFGLMRAGRAVRAVHLRGGAADPEARWPASAPRPPSAIWMNSPPARVWVYRDELALICHARTVIRRWRGNVLLPKILVFPARSAPRSYNVRLAAVAARS